MRLFSGTEYDRPPVCDRCERPLEECECPAEEPQRQLTPPNKQVARLALERRKRGKVVTVVRGLAADESDLPQLLTQLKSSCGAGGAVKEDTIEIQGDHRQRIETQLAEIGYRVRVSG